MFCCKYLTERKNSRMSVQLRQGFLTTWAKRTNCATRIYVLRARKLSGNQFLCHMQISLSIMNLVGALLPCVKKDGYQPMEHISPMIGIRN